MIKDIPVPEVNDIAVAVIPEEDENEGLAWSVYLLNLKDTPIEGVLVSSKGYGELNGEQIKTSTLRHFIEKIEPGNFSKVEPLPDVLLDFFNEYFITYYVGSVLFDKKFVFEPYSINGKNSAFIGSIGQNGILLS